jgi:hypothetical protein
MQVFTVVRRTHDPIRWASDRPQLACFWLDLYVAKLCGKPVLQLFDFRFPLFVGNIFELIALNRVSLSQLSKRPVT